jgi:hypothetical protein
MRNYQQVKNLTCRLNFMVTDEERQLITEAIERQGGKMKLSFFLRNLCVVPAVEQIVGRTVSSW